MSKTYRIDQILDDATLVEGTVAFSNKRDAIACGRAIAKTAGYDVVETLVVDQDGASVARFQKAAA